MNFRTLRLSFKSFLAQIFRLWGPRIFCFELFLKPIPFFKPLIAPALTEYMPSMALSRHPVLFSSLTSCQLLELAFNRKSSHSKGDIGNSRFDYEI